MIIPVDSHTEKKLSSTASYINFGADYQCPKKLTLDDIKHETKRDEMLQ